MDFSDTDSAAANVMRYRVITKKGWPFMNKICRINPVLTVLALAVITIISFP